MAERTRHWSGQRVLLVALGVAVLVEVGWTINLGSNLPANYEAVNWVPVWVGVDVAQMVMLLLTMWALWRQRAVVIAAASVTGALFVVDGWFDVVTARRGDLTQSVLLAIFWEGPWAMVLFAVVAWSLRRLGPSGDSERRTSPWSVPLTRDGD